MASSATNVSIAQPIVDLATSLSNPTGVKVTPGKNGSAFITIQNIGNIPASGNINFNLYASTSSTYDANAILIASTTLRKLKLKPGQTYTIKIKFNAPSNLVAGSYNLIAASNSMLSLGDVNTGNDVAVMRTVG